jgi:hypothetical protein
VLHFLFIYILAGSFFAYIVFKGYSFKLHDLQVLAKSTGVTRYTQEMQMLRVFLMLSSFFFLSCSDLITRGLFRSASF